MGLGALMKRAPPMTPTHTDATTDTAAPWETTPLAMAARRQHYGPRDTPYTVTLPGPAWGPGAAPSVTLPTIKAAHSWAVLTGALAERCEVVASNGWGVAVFVRDAASVGGWGVERRRCH